MPGPRRSSRATRSIRRRWSAHRPQANIDIGRQEGAELLTGGGRNDLPGDLGQGFYVKPTVFKGQALLHGSVWNRAGIHISGRF